MALYVIRTWSFKDGDWRNIAHGIKRVSLAVSIAARQAIDCTGVQVLLGRAVVAEWKDGARVRVKNEDVATGFQAAENDSRERGRQQQRNQAKLKDYERRQKPASASDCVKCRLRVRAKPPADAGRDYDKYRDLCVRCRKAAGWTPRLMCKKCGVKFPQRKGLCRRCDNEENGYVPTVDREAERIARNQEHSRQTVGTGWEPPADAILEDGAYWRLVTIPREPGQKEPVVARVFIGPACKTPVIKQAPFSTPIGSAADAATS